MAVTSSVATFDGPVQADGRRQVIERHQFTGGEIATYTYFAMPDDDIQSVATARAVSLLEAAADAEALATARAVSLLEAAADAEALANVERDGPFTLNHQTGVQFAGRFREMVRSATKERACYLAWWLTRRIAQGHTTDAAVRSAFGMTAGQWTTFKANKVQPRADAWTAVLAATGE